MRLNPESDDQAALDEETIIQWLTVAVQRVALEQPELWSFNEGEETRVAQVLLALRELVPTKWSVDLEYRRRGALGQVKERTSGQRARPDVVIHRRGDESADGNILVAEFKNFELGFLDLSSEDGKKVVDLQGQFGYSVGALISFGPTATVPGPRILWRHSNGTSFGPSSI